MTCAVAVAGWIRDWFPYLTTFVGIAISLVVSSHVLLTKREIRAAIGWIGLLWLAPFLGTTLYVLLGINRIQRRARSLRRGMHRTGFGSGHLCSPEQLRAILTAENAHLVPVARLVEKVTGTPLLSGNVIEPLVDGDETFPAMLQAIDEAKRSVALSTYIFYNDRVGRQFIDALGRAVRRGVEVRVLIDDFGSRYGWSTIVGPLRAVGVKVATFIPTLVPAWITYINLRNHRKILVADGRVGFTGGMNIDQTFLHDGASQGRNHDLHFRVRGPVVADLLRLFVDDWTFCTNEVLEGEAWFPRLEPVGATPARCVPDGPDEGDDKLLMTILGAIGVARSSVAIVTPYFLPDQALLSALEVAALRGVEVDIVLPRSNNLKLVQWASMPFIERLLMGGCRVWYSPPPFDHSKLLLVDRAWAFIGSANIDPRSLRLNFEVNVECYGTDFAHTLEGEFLKRKSRATPLTLEQVRGRGIPVKLRDGLASLLSPYL